MRETRLRLGICVEVLRQGSLPCAFHSSLGLHLLYQIQTGCYFLTNELFIVIVMYNTRISARYAGFILFNVMHCNIM